MQLTYQLTQTDMLEWSRAASRSYRLLKPIGVLWIIGTIANFALNWGKINNVGEMIGPSLLSLGGIYLLFADRLSVYLACRRNPKLLGDRSVEFSDDGVTVTTADSESQMRWSNWNGWTETQNQLILWQGQNSGFPFPKRVFDSFQIEALKQLLVAKLGPARKPKASSSFIRVVIVWLIIVVVGVCLWQLLKH
jgi:hypothetical protein